MAASVTGLSESTNAPAELRREATSWVGRLGERGGMNEYVGGVCEWVRSWRVDERYQQALASIYPIVLHTYIYTCIQSTTNTHNTHETPTITHMRTAITSPAPCPDRPSDPPVVVVV